MRVTTFFVVVLLLGVVHSVSAECDPACAADQLCDVSNTCQACSTDSTHFLTAENVCTACTVCGPRGETTACDATNDAVCDCQEGQTLTDGACVCDAAAHFLDGAGDCQACDESCSECSGAGATGCVATACNAEYYHDGTQCTACEACAAVGATETQACLGGDGGLPRTCACDPQFFGDGHTCSACGDAATAAAVSDSSVSAVGDSADYQWACDAGFYLVSGTALRTCDATAGSDPFDMTTSPPVCADCQAKADALATADGTSLVHVADTNEYRVECAAGFWLDPTTDLSRSAFCDPSSSSGELYATAELSGSALTSATVQQCTPCSSVAAQDGTTFVQDEADAAVFTWTCDAGTHATPVPRTCDVAPSGSDPWVGDAIVCTDCSPDPAIADSTVTSEGAVFTWLCNAGFYMETGDSERTCDATAGSDPFGAAEDTPSCTDCQAKADALATADGTSLVHVADTNEYRVECAAGFWLDPTTDLSRSAFCDPSSSSGELYATAELSGSALTSATVQQCTPCSSVAAQDGTTFVQDEADAAVFTWTCDAGTHATPVSQTCDVAPSGSDPWVGDAIVCIKCTADALFPANFGHADNVVETIGEANSVFQWNCASGFNTFTDAVDRQLTCVATSADGITEQPALFECEPLVGVVMGVSATTETCTETLEADTASAASAASQSYVTEPDTITLVADGTFVLCTEPETAEDDSAVTGGGDGGLGRRLRNSSPRVLETDSATVSGQVGLESTDLGAASAVVVASANDPAAFLPAALVDPLVSSTLDFGESCAIPAYPAAVYPPSHVIAGATMDVTYTCELGWYDAAQDSENTLSCETSAWTSASQASVDACAADASTCFITCTKCDDKASALAGPNMSITESTNPGEYVVTCDNGYYPDPADTTGVTTFYCDPNSDGAMFPSTDYVAGEELTASSVVQCLDPCAEAGQLAFWTAVNPLSDCPTCDDADPCQMGDLSARDAGAVCVRPVDRIATGVSDYTCDCTTSQEVPRGTQPFWSFSQPEGDLLFDVCLPQYTLVGGGVYSQVLGQSGKVRFCVTPNCDDDPNAVTVTMDALAEEAADGSAVGTTGSVKHSFNTFASKDFEFYEDCSRDGSEESRVTTYPGTDIHVSCLLFEATDLLGTATAENPDGAAIRVYIYVADELGRDETAQSMVGPDEEGAATTVTWKRGTVKFNVEVEGWEFCDSTEANCRKGGSNQHGSSLALDIEIKSKGKPTKVTSGVAGTADYSLGGADLKVALWASTTAVDGSKQWWQLDDTPRDWMSSPPADAGSDPDLTPDTTTRGSKEILTLRFPRVDGGGLMFIDPNIEFEEAACTTDPCPSGQYESAACGDFSDRVCSACPTSPCSAGTYESSPCVDGLARECSVCAAACTEGVSWETTRCTATTDRVCQSCRTCGPNAVQTSACTLFSDTECSCPSGTHGNPYSSTGCLPCDETCADACVAPGPVGCQACAAEHYRASDGSCTTCAVCDADATATGCDGTVTSGNRVCECNPGFFGSGLEGDCTACHPSCSLEAGCDGPGAEHCLGDVCSAGFWYDGSSGTCVGCSTCVAGTAGGTTESGSCDGTNGDRECGCVRPTHFGSGLEGGDGCTGCSACDPSSEYQVAACTDSADTQCAMCDAACDGGCTGPSASDCSACAEGYWMDGSGVCQACSAPTCGDDEYVSAACSATADRQCAPCHSSCSGACSGPTAADCAACDSTFWYDGSVCQTCGSCDAPNQYVVSTCSPATNTVCGSCDVSCSACNGPASTDCTACPGSTYLETDGSCAACTVCSAPNTVAASACTASADAVCECQSGYHGDAMSAAGCTRDCILTPFADWEPCLATCGTGVQTRRRSVGAPARPGGSCDGDLIETRECAMDPCAPPATPIVVAVVEFQGLSVEDFTPGRRDAARQAFADEIDRPVADVTIRSINPLPASSRRLATGLARLLSASPGVSITYEVAVDETERSTVEDSVETAVAAPSFVTAFTSSTSLVPTSVSSSVTSTPVASSSPSPSPGPVDPSSGSGGSSTVLIAVGVVCGLVVVGAVAVAVVKLRGGRKSNSPMKKTANVVVRQSPHSDHPKTLGKDEQYMLDNPIHERAKVTPTQVRR